MGDLLANHSWLWWILIGGLAGLIAKAIMPGRDPGGCIVTIVLGIAGAVVAGFIGRAIGWYEDGDRGASFIAAIVGALIILGIYRLVAGRRM
jgi:uncharacterized membrane protein YeaQ/YmgE (transglycosylase-associated protein family)